MKVSSIPFISLLVTFCIINLANSWPSGAPESTCNTLLPSHGSNRPKPATSSPFVLAQSHQDFEAGDKVKVTLKGPRGVSFKGLIVQAYDPQTNEPVGSFQAGRGLKTLDSCGAVTHTDRRGKRSATLLWQAPENSNGKVGFRATVVQRFSEFYRGLEAVIDPNA